MVRMYEGYGERGAADVGELDRAAFVRAELARTVDELEWPPDLVPAAVAQGRRRRVRTRAGVAAGVAVVVAAGWLALPGWPAPAPRALDAAGPSRAAAPAPDGEWLRMGDAERGRLRAFKREAADVLDRRLPAAVGAVAPDAGTADTYTGRSGAHTFPVAFSVRPDPRGGRLPCASAPAKGLVCERAVLAGGVAAAVRTGSMNSGADSGVSVVFRYGGSLVRLAVAPDAAAGRAAPLTGAELTAVASDPALLDLVREADGRPVLAPVTEEVRGG
ncbi:hypothetical protein ACFQLX_19565 [Streptomyces polyrhachis]|uniref:Uncharacterized protein n=1 Tax=Streptomyces polyrhachis TaxID=1282885 RepID=A0ABW2GHS8_9ACTN